MKIKPGVLWPAVIAGALTLHVVGSLMMVYVATSNESFAVEPDYYRKALAWDDKRAQDHRNAEFGWQLNFTVEPAAPGHDPKIRVDLVDADGLPLNHAKVSLEAFANTQADKRFAVDLTAVDDHYEINLPMRRDGLWEFRFEVTRGDDKFTYLDVRHVWTSVRVPGQTKLTIPSPETGLLTLFDLAPALT